MKVQQQWVSSDLSFNKFWNKPESNGVYSRNSLPKIKDGAYVINLDEVKPIATHWIALALLLKM